MWNETCISNSGFCIFIFSEQSVSGLVQRGERLKVSVGPHMEPTLYLVFLVFLLCILNERAERKWGGAERD